MLSKTPYITRLHGRKGLLNECFGRGNSEWLQAQGLIGGFDGIKKTEKLLDVSHFEDRANPIVDSYQRKTAPILLAIDVGAHQSPDTGGIGVGHAAEVENQQRARSRRALSPENRTCWKSPGVRSGALHVAQTGFRRTPQSPGGLPASAPENVSADGGTGRLKEC